MRGGATIIVAVLALPGAAMAARPLFTDDPAPVPTGRLQLQAGALFLSGPGDRDFTVPVNVAYGPWPGVEVSAGMNALVNDEAGSDFESGVGDLVLAAKVRLFDEEKHLLSQGFTAYVKIPTSEDLGGVSTGRPDWDFNWIVSRSIGPNANVYFNAGYTYTGNRGEDRIADVLHYGIGFDYQLTKTLQPVAEIYGQSPLNPGGAPFMIADVGMRWQVADGLVLDALVGTGLNDESPDLVATVGFTWVF